MSTTTIDEAYQERLETELSECDIQIRELKERVERMLANAEVEHYRKIEALRGRERAVRDRLRGATGLSGLTVEQIQADVENEVDDLKRSIERALEEYR